MDLIIAEWFLLETKKLSFILISDAIMSSSKRYYFESGYKCRLIEIQSFFDTLPELKITPSRTKLCCIIGDNILGDREKKYSTLFYSKILTAIKIINLLNILVPTAFMTSCKRNDKNDESSV